MADAAERDRASRRQARRAALILLYQRDLTGRPLPDLEAAYEQDAGQPVPRFARGLIDGVDAERERIDAAIARHAKGWSLDRIAPVERAALRIAAYELLHADGEVPAPVAIDEAVRLAKRYASPEASVFVNGVLGAIARELGVGR